MVTEWIRKVKYLTIIIREEDDKKQMELCRY